MSGTEGGTIYICEMNVRVNSPSFGFHGHGLSHLPAAHPWDPVVGTEQVPEHLLPPHSFLPLKLVDILLGK